MQGIGWSGPPSFVSSSGPSSPTGLSDGYSRGSSDMSASLVSSDGYFFKIILHYYHQVHNFDLIIIFFRYPIGNSGAISQMFPKAPGLDEDLGNVGLLLETGEGGFSEICSSQRPGKNVGPTIKLNFSYHLLHPMWALAS